MDLKKKKTNKPLCQTKKLSSRSFLTGVLSSNMDTSPLHPISLLHGSKCDLHESFRGLPAAIKIKQSSSAVITRPCTVWRLPTSPDPSLMRLNLSLFSWPSGLFIIPCSYLAPFCHRAFLFLFSLPGKLFPFCHHLDNSNPVAFKLYFLRGAFSDLQV